MFHEHITDLIGNTPLVKLHQVVADVPATVVAKIEWFNPGHSVKDRIALKMIEEAERKGWLRPGGTIIEGTSGNTGMGLALVAIKKGYRCIFTTTDKQSKEKVDILKALGAEVIVCPTNVPADDPRSYYSVARRLSEQIPNSWYVNQYDNLDNRRAHYETTGPEIWAQTEGRITHLVAGAGTGGTITGTAMYLKEKNPDIIVWAVDTYGSTLKAYHETGRIDPNEIYPYLTEGIGEDIIPANYDFSLIDHFEKVTDRDAALMAREITRREGIFVGYSSGSAVQAIRQLKHLLRPEHLVVVILPDHGSRYIGKIYNDEWMRDRGWLRPATVADLISTRRPLISVSANTPVSEVITLLAEHGIDQMPVMEAHEPVGSITESIILNRLLEDISVRNWPVQAIMHPPFPLISMDTTLESLSALLQQNQAVLVRDAAANLHILTKTDLMKALAC
ncbi:MAG: pyridoxal-phosphate dependent enzyme [Chitinophagales bacterium]|nr:pyridoxal-phosphate dependent enzyme [Chitinophagales bacterium]MDW8427306.1 pyridoxal-phosphate dependent enzyme [Chitinophagales bacterium]